MQASHEDLGTITVAEFKRRTGLGHTKTYDELKSGRLKARKVGRRAIIPLSDFRAWLDSLPAADLGEVA